MLEMLKDKIREAQDEKAAMAAARKVLRLEKNDRSLIRLETGAEFVLLARHGDTDDEDRLVIVRRADRSVLAFRGNGRRHAGAMVNQKGVDAAARQFFEEEGL